MKSLTRREFITLVGAATGLGIACWILLPQPAFAGVLPPGARTPLIFFSAMCSRCGKCVSACPHNAMRQNSQGLPYLDGLGGWCNFCMNCADVCLTGALQSIDPKTTVLGVAVINRERCIAWIRSGCRLCYEKCLDLRQAIHVDSQFRPRVEEDKCNGCGACVYVCPQSIVDGLDKSRGKAIALRPV